MPTTTTNMSLAKPIDADVAEVYLVGTGSAGLAGAMDKLDVHRHTGGADGLTIPAGGLAAGAVLAASIAAGAATGAALGADVVKVSGASLTGLLQETGGTTIPSANNLTLTLDGNLYIISGVTAVNLISSTSWQVGAIVTLVTSGALTVVHGIANSGAFHTILLNGAVNFVMAANSSLTLVKMTGQWNEIGRKA